MYSVVLTVIFRITPSDLTAFQHVTPPTTSNFALTLVERYEHSNSRHGVACRILKVGYVQTFMFAFSTTNATT